MWKWCRISSQTRNGAKKRTWLAFIIFTASETNLNVQAHNKTFVLVPNWMAATYIAEHMCSFQETVSDGAIFVSVEKGTWTVCTSITARHTQISTNCTKQRASLQQCQKKKGEKYTSLLHTFLQTSLDFAPPPSCSKCPFPLQSKRGICFDQSILPTQHQFPCLGGGGISKIS